jgi:leucyl-tRNA synthetase
MVLGKTYRHPKTKKYLKLEELEIGPDAKSLEVIGDNENPMILWEKMSKSKFNGTDPQKCIEKWGADATRAHMLFQGRIEDELQWEEERIIGIQRWFERLWKHVKSLAPQLAVPEFLILPNRDLHNIPVDRVDSDDRTLFGTLQKTIRDVSFCLSKSATLNTVVSSLIKLTNVLVTTHRSVPGEPPGTGKQPFSLGMNYRATSVLLRLLSPVAPGFSEECWELLHTHVPQMAGTRASESPWPWFAYQEGEDFGGMATCVVQVNGKVRMSKMEVDRKRLLGKDAKRATRYILKLVKRAEPMQQWLGGKMVKKVYIAGNGKLVNLLVD